jgi:hypothetical protein
MSASQRQQDGSSDDIIKPIDQNAVPTSSFSSGDTDDGMHSDDQNAELHRFRQPLRQCAIVTLVGFLLFMIGGSAAVLNHGRIAFLTSLTFGGAIELLIVAYIALRLLTARGKLFSTTHTAETG